MKAHNEASSEASLTLQSLQGGGTDRNGCFGHGWRENSWKEGRENTGVEVPRVKIGVDWRCGSPDGRGWPLLNSE